MFKHFNIYSGCSSWHNRCARVLWWGLRRR